MSLISKRDRSARMFYKAVPVCWCLAFEKPWRDVSEILSLLYKLFPSADLGRACSHSHSHVVVNNAPDV